MWFVRLTHALFGWHWVTFQFGSSDIIRRVKRAPNGRLYVAAYGGLIFLDTTDRHIVPLTWVEDNVRPLKRAG